MFEVVTLAAPNVRPWKAPRNATIPGRPVTRRASLSAPSIASEPELRNMIVSIGSGRVVGEHPGERDDGLGVADRPGRPDQPVDLGVDRRGHPRMGVTEGRDRDPVRKVEVGAAGRVEQAMADAVTPAALEVATEDRRQVRRLGGEIGDRGDGFIHRPSIGSGHRAMGQRLAFGDGRLRPHG